jgi:CNT family concentrative nucleoside transporter
MATLHGLLGLGALLFIAWVLSEDRFRVPVRVVVGGVVLQLVLAVILLRFPPARSLFLMLNEAVAALQEATDAGTTFVFGYLGGGPLPFAETKPGASFILGFGRFPWYS